jgi:hypothetical protein
LKQAQITPISAMKLSDSALRLRKQTTSCTYRYAKLVAGTNRARRSGIFR